MHERFLLICHQSLALVCHRDSHLIIRKISERGEIRMVVRFVRSFRLFGRMPLVRKITSIEVVTCSCLQSKFWQQVVSCILEVCRPVMIDANEVRIGWFHAKICSRSECFCLTFKIKGKTGKKNSIGWNLLANLIIIKRR